MAPEPFYPIDVAEHFAFEKAEKKPEFCCFCGKELNKLTSNDARPVSDGRCCVTCNLTIVATARIRELKEAK